MKRKAILSIALAGMLAFGAGLGTMAWFTSTATSETNIFEAGTLTLDVNGANGEEKFDFNVDLNFDNLQPGDSLTDGTAEIVIKNTGSLNMATFGRFTLDADEDFGKYMKIKEYKVEFFNADGTQKDRVDNFIENGVVLPVNMAGNMYDWVNGSGPQDIMTTAWDMEALKPQEYFKISFELEYDVDAEVQGLDATLGYEVLATQVNEQAIIDLELEGVPESTITYNGGVYDYLAKQVDLQ